MNKYKVLVHNGKFVNEGNLGTSKDIRYIDTPTLYREDIDLQKDFISINTNVCEVMGLSDQIKLYEENIKRCELKDYFLYDAEIFDGSKPLVLSLPKNMTPREVGEFKKKWNNAMNGSEF